MEKETIQSSKVLWNEAAKYGLVLGLFTSAFIFLDWGISQIGVSGVSSAIMTNVLSIIIWFVKFIGCGYIMYRLIKNLETKFDGVTRQQEVSYGTMLAVTSGFIYAAAMFINVTYLNPDTIKASMDAVISAMQLSDSEMAIMEKTARNIPIATFFVQWIYCIAYGAILSRIISRSNSDDMFGDTTGTHGTTSAE